MIWKILEIEKTKDEELIKKAYRDKLRYVNPEDDQEGFKELRRAYEEALDYALKEEEAETSESENQGYYGKKNEVDLWIDQVNVVYQDVKTRIDESRWQKLFQDAVCLDLDTEIEAGEKLLVYFMSHSNMPQNIWQLIDKRFDYLENLDHLKEKFPENYLDYVKWQINRPGFIDYRLFDGQTDKDVDSYINKLYEVKAVSEERDLSKVKQLIKELKRFDVTHPFTETEEARCLLLEAELLKEKDANNPAIKDLLADALSIMEELDFEYSDNAYIERIYAETLMKNNKIAQAKQVYEAIMNQDNENHMAKLGIAECIFLEGNPEDAKEQIEDVLEERVQDAESLALLERVNEVLVEKYENQLKTEFTADLCYKLGWCYYQQKRFEEGLHLLERVENTSEYDYINLRCRLHLASNQYEKAMPYAHKWLEQIEEAEDDGSKEMKKRKNRLSLAHFSIGVCHWETIYKHAKEEDKEEAVSTVTRYIEMAIEEETNRLVGLSYKEQLACFYLDAKQYEKCIEICDQIIKADRGFFPAYVHRQKAHYELKHAKEVIDDYFSCIEIYPEYAPPYTLAAEVFYAFDQYDDVEQVLNSAKEAGIESDCLDLYRIRCLHYKEFSKENTEKALVMLEALREKISNCQKEKTDIEDMAEVEKEYAILFWDLDNVSMTLSVINEFLNEHPNHIAMLHLKVDVLIREKKSGALETCKHILQLEPDNLQIKVRLGNCYEALDEIEKAIKCYEEVLEENPNFIPAIRRMMYVYSYLSNQNNNLKQCALAIDYATRYIELTESSDGYLERGNLYIDLYELEKSVADCKKAIELDENAYYAYNNLGCALLKLRRLDEAIEPLEKAIQMDPNRDHLPYLNLAECYILQKDYRKALETYKIILKLRPNSSNMQKKIAEMYVEMKQYKKAIDMYMKLIHDIKAKSDAVSVWNRIKIKMRVEPSDDEKRIMLLYCDVADVYRQAGDIKSAEKYYNKIYSTYRKLFKRFNADVVENIAEYYRDSGNIKKAINVMDHVRKGKLAQSEINTWEEHHMSFVYAMLMYEIGDKTAAKNSAEHFIKELLKKHGGEEELLSELRYRPTHLHMLGMMYACAGELEKAKYYIGQIPDYKKCVMCESCDCYEYYFGMGFIAEIENRKEDAIRFYKKSIEIAGDYPCAQHYLDKLTKNNM